ncbi:hypothetical protein BE20_05930 [Sorangium cellulosum]|nr:hypothetical protein BE20_05930 [Sorangium cellulosum]
MSISYGHMTDASVTNEGVAEDPARRSALYLARSGTPEDCGYPRRCVVGPRRVVSAYALNNGADRPRRFEVGYERIVTDLDTGAVTIDAYDHVTFDDDLQVFPFAGRVQRTWRGAPGLPSQPRPEQIELSFADVRRTLVPTNDGATYFTMRQAQGIYPPRNGSTPAIEAYMREVERGGDGATLLRDSVSKVTTFNVTRTFKNDAERWVLGQLETQKECSAAASRHEAEAHLHARRLREHHRQRTPSGTIGHSARPTTRRACSPRST